MILPGRVLIPKIISEAISSEVQTQPCGVDLTLKRILEWTSRGVVDFDNSQRETSSTREIPFQAPPRGLDAKTTEAAAPAPAAFVDLAPGSFLVEFNEAVDTPLDVMGQIFVRSSLFRSGALMSAGVMDAGYRGAVGALLQVVNPHGLRLYKDARLAQMVFHKMSEPVEGYKGAYQGRETV